MAPNELNVLVWNKLLMNISPLEEKLFHSCPSIILWLVFEMYVLVSTNQAMHPGRDIHRQVLIAVWIE